VETPGTDIETPEDIRLLVDAFYEKVRVDGVIGYLFNEVAKVDWDRHLPVMYAFWENVLFHTGAYGGNPMTAHLHLHRQSPLSAVHFQHWYGLFRETIDDHFAGPMAEMAKQRALSIATLMQIRIAGNQTDEQRR
jgi:hemoglobin